MFKALMTCPMRFVSVLLLVFGPLVSYGESVTSVSDPRTAGDTVRAQQVLAQRCVVCHACYDAPCQLKLEAHEGLERGASKALVYDGLRLKGAPLTRLFEDAHSVAGWRNKGFYSVLGAAEKPGVMQQMLDLKRRQDFPRNTRLPDDDYDFALDRDQHCARQDEFASFADAKPTWGMPYGLPALSDEEHEVLSRWLASGAPGVQPTVINDALAAEVGQWEAWFNGEALKQQLISRYLFEHLFLAHLYFQDDGGETVFFRLVRSATPPGQPIRRISTRRPFDDPQVDRVYYRLWQDPSLVVDKTHMPYALNSERMEKWQRWFMEPDYGVAKLPGYQPEKASNPFQTFKAIPPYSRHRFLLDEAEFTIKNFIKGPVCRGNIALNVIQDHFWVFFSSPELSKGQDFSKFLAEQDQHLRLPAGAVDKLLPVAQWLRYSQAQNHYIQAKADYMRTRIIKGTLDKIWNGDGVNSNAALTVFRHKDTATVEKGLLGQEPMTAWVIDYPILERIHYLLVAGFDVFGNVSHQAMTRMYMDFLRMESEMNFLAFLPEQSRKAEVSRWYTDAMGDVSGYLREYFQYEEVVPLEGYHTGSHKQELFAQIENYLAPVLVEDRDIASSGLPEAIQQRLQALQQVQGGPATVMPETLFVDIKDGGMLTLIGNRSYTNISSMFEEKERRWPEKDSITVVNGLLGAYPHGFLQVAEADLPELLNRLENLQKESHYDALMARFGVRRTHPKFWEFSDRLHQQQQAARPLDSGILDYSRLENR